MCDMYSNRVLCVGMYRISGSGYPVPDIRFRMAGYPAIYLNPVPAPVPAKMVPGTGYPSRIVLGPFWHLVELSSPS